jgi:vacuolar-type H+-ATPase subunit E/Vma4
MNAAGKLDYFAEVISREVESKRRRAKHQAANNLSISTAKAIEAAQNKADLELEKVRRGLLRESNKKIAAATYEARAAYNVLRSRLREDVFKAAEKELWEFTEKSEYEIYLSEQINALKSDFAFVLLCPRDMRFSRAAAGLIAEEGLQEYIGGFILLSENRKIQADYTFKTRLEACMQ